MKQDVLDAIALNPPRKIPHKESLNHPGWIEKHSGMDVYSHYEDAYLITIKACGIDFTGGIPHDSDARRPPADNGEIFEIGRKKYRTAPLGVSPTSACTDYGFYSVEDVLAYDPERDDPLDTAELAAMYKGHLDRATSLLGDYGQW